MEILEDSQKLLKFIFSALKANNSQKNVIFIWSFDNRLLKNVFDLFCNDS